MAKKQNVTITDLIVQNPSLKASLSKFENVKLQLDQRASQCLLIKVTNESSLTVCENNLAKMNDLLKEVESVHKEIKKPYWDSCVAIDVAKNYVLGFDVNPVDYLKSEKVNYIKAIEKEAKRKTDLQQEFNKSKFYLEETLSNTITLWNCDWYIGRLSILPDATKWQELTIQVNELYKNYITLFELKKQELIALEHASPDEIEAINQLKEEIKESISNSVVVDNTPAIEIKKVRRTWKFEIANLSEVPREFLMVDESKVKEWMKLNEDVLVDGDVSLGIKFFKEISTTV